MERKEIKNSEAGREKKLYSAPKMEAIANVREITKGDTGSDPDNGGHQSGPPSDNQFG